MESYGILFTLDTNIQNKYRDWIHRFASNVLKQSNNFGNEKQPLPLPSTTLHLSLITPHTHEEQLCWVKLVPENVSAGVERVLAQVSVSDEATEWSDENGQTQDCVTEQTIGECLSECLDSVVALLPPIDKRIDVLWFCETEDVPDIDDNLGLFGSLWSLIVNHNAYVSIVTADSTLATTLHPWMHILRAQHLTPDGLGETQQGCVWRGDMIIQESQSAAPLVLSGFNMQYTCPKKPPITYDITEEQPKSFTKALDIISVPSNMYFIARVEKKSIPLFYFTSQFYKINVPSKSKHLTQSHVLIDSLKKEQMMCYIVRLCMTQSKHIIQTIKDNSKKDQAEESNSPEPYYLALYCGDELDHIEGCLLTPITGLDGAVAKSLIDLEMTTPLLEMQSDPHDIDPAKMCNAVLNGLPHYTGYSLALVHRAVEEIQAATLHKWASECASRGESRNISIDDLVTILATVRSMVLARLEEVGPMKVIPTLEETTLLDENNISSEYDRSKYTSLEYAAMTARAENQRVMQRNQSNDSIFGLAPPTETGKILKLDVTEFLKHFNGDGTSHSEDLEQIQIRSPRLCRYIAESEQVWSGDDGEAKEIVHGTHLNRGTLVDKLEKKCDKMKARLLHVETYSTCCGDQTGCPAVITLPLQVNKEQPNKKDRKYTEQLSKTSQDKRSGVRQSMENQRISENGKNTTGNMSTKRQSNANSKSKSISTNKQSINAADADREARLKRSQRHKKKLEEVVLFTLESKGVKKGDTIFKACAQRLYTLVKCFVKDLASSHNLRQEMSRLAEQHVVQVIEFEKTRTT